MVPPEEGQKRVIIEGVSPELNAGKFPIKRVAGEKIVVEADIFTDSHDAISAVVRYRDGMGAWQEAPMTPLVNDRWQAEFTVNQLGRSYYTVQAWIDRFKSWSRDLKKRVEAGQDVRIDLLIGAQLVEETIQNAAGEDADKLETYATVIRAGAHDSVMHALSPDLADLMYRYYDRRYAHTYPRELEVMVEPPYARFSAWYEFFPRSFGAAPGQHGTFKTCEPMLDYIASMNFDIVYLPPIHPIGRTYRKGKNNNPVSQPGDVGSPWAIGAEEGGHKSVHPQLGTLEDFREFVQKAADRGLKVAMDIAFQCSPDHPYVKSHPDWFRQRPDGTIQYAENPPKKYQDIYPFDFETDDWEALWEELKSIFLFWIEQGVHVFRVDNPHTKSFRFWEWAIAEIKKDHPEAIFLSEAFTRPKVMYQLAKLGFTLSYNYFPWRNTAYELREYLTELTRSEVREFFGPSLWPNTPDILPQYLQFSGRPGFLTRFVLASTLGACYGIYGPAFELGVAEPAHPGAEEYLDSEKYELKNWNLDQPGSLRDLMGRVNWVRRENPALQSNQNLKFHPTSNDQLLCYSKSTDDLENIVLVVVNLDPHYVQSGFVELPLEAWGLDSGRPLQVHDQVTQARYLWHGSRNYVELKPFELPFHIFVVRRYVRTEKDFDYFM